MDTRRAGFELNLMYDKADSDSVLNLFFGFSTKARDTVRWIRVVSIEVGLCIAQLTKLGFDGKLKPSLASFWHPYSLLRGEHARRPLRRN